MAIKLLFLAPHLSTGGMPSFVLKRVESLLNYQDFEIHVVEFSNYSDEYAVQKNRIKELVPNFYTLGDDKMELINIIKANQIDVVHIDEMVEGFDAGNQMPKGVMKALYHPDRTWRIVETCHNVWFNPDKLKKFHPDMYAFCTPYHLQTFNNMPSPAMVIEFPIDKKERASRLEDYKIFDPSVFNVLNVGLWTSGKNQKEGIEIARRYPNLKFHFVGNQAPNFKDYWEPLMQDLPDNVTIWGERNDVDAFMREASIFMFNSTWECNPLVLREAISYGLPIISRNLPQYVDMFTDYLSDMDSNLNQIYTMNNEYVVPTDNTSKHFAKKHAELYSIVTKLSVREQPIEPVTIMQHFVNQPYIEIQGDTDSVFDIEMYEGDDILSYKTQIKANQWVKLNRQYFTNWKTQIYQDGELIYNEQYNARGKRVLIAFQSSSLGDTIAWIPYCEEFKKKHNCHVIVSTFKNDLFRDMYPHLEFIEPGQAVDDLYAMYNIGWFYDSNKEPVLPNTIPLQKTITNILGLTYAEKKPLIKFNQGEHSYDEDRYITIATNSTAGCKLWTVEGWQNLVKYFNDKGYLVVNISKEQDVKLEGVIQLEDTSLENTMNVLYHSRFFVGLSSGLSWLAWGMRKDVVMISNFTEADHEFTTHCTRITNTKVCNSCWNNPNFKFDKADWNWCPIYKNTSRHFECHRSISAKMVIREIEKKELM